MSQFKETQCACSKCVTMCERNPCWPTPDEARTLIAAGYGDRLMTDWWDDFPNDTHLLCPAAEGHENRMAPAGPMFFQIDWHKGRCTFLTKEGKCELHTSGLKPLEGRVADCKESSANQDLREHIIELWKKEQSNFEFHGNAEDLP